MKVLSGLALAAFAVVWTFECIDRRIGQGIEGRVHRMMSRADVQAAQP